MLRVVYLLLLCNNGLGYQSSHARSMRMNIDKTPSDIIKVIGSSGDPIGTPWSYYDYTKHLGTKEIDGVSIITNNDKVTGLFAIDNVHNTGDVMASNIHAIKTIPDLTTTILQNLDTTKIPFDIFDTTQTSLLNSIPWPLQIVGYYFIGSILFSFILQLRMNTQGPNNNSNKNVMNPLQMLSNNNNNQIDTDILNVTFADVAGCDEAKEELTEVVEFLKNPLKFAAAGATIPKGVLLEGPPGTGKTLLARAVAGEAGVPFFSASGSQFIEMFVGVGASRVRDLFENAEKETPCVIFIDEIDAVGRQRGTGLAGGNDEREQTLNQILTNMDGFTKSTGIIVLGATNRADILDNALTRPGRFDRKVMVGLPDAVGRREIMNVHFKNKQVNNQTDLDDLNALTTGFSGADIANLANEAAILSVRYNETSITKHCLYDAYEKMTIGLPKKYESRNDKILNMVAYHETGHTITALLFNDMFNLQKVTINSNKNGAGGYTLFTPKDSYSEYPTKKFLLANMIIAMGGRAAEVVLYNTTSVTTNRYVPDAIFPDINQLDITTGASNDLKQANSIARQYISLFGLGRNIGLYDSTSNEQPFLGRNLATNSDKLSEYSKELIDKEIANMIQFSYETAIKIIQKNNDSFHEIARLLLKDKTITGNSLDTIPIFYHS
jgi:cell division protease FtsH